MGEPTESIVYPSRDRKGNLLTKIAAPALAVALAACTSSATETTKTPSLTKQPGITGQPFPTTSSPMQEQVSSEMERIDTNRAISSFATNMAKQILDESETTDAYKFIYDPKDGGPVAVNIAPIAPSTLGGKFGEYGLTATMKRGANGELDPKTVDMIMIYMNVNFDGAGPNEPGDRRNIYAFMLIKDPGGNWDLYSTFNDLKGHKSKLDRDTEVYPGNTPLTRDVFSLFSLQALDVFDHAVAGNPVKPIQNPLK